VTLTSGSDAPLSVPQHCPTPRELDDLELLVAGAFAPITGFNEPGSPITLTLPASLAAVPEVELVDPEGLPLARVALTIDPSTTTSDSSTRWEVRALTMAQYGPFRRLHLTPVQARAAYAGRTFVPVDDALTAGQIAEIDALGPVVLLALAGTGTPTLSSVALIRATLAAADLMSDAAVVAIPLATHGDATVDHTLGVQVVGNYAAGDPVHGLSEDSGPLPEAVASIVAFDQPAPGDQGLVLFFTGLSGSGKSTVAQAVMDTLLEQGERTITSLDGDVVRRNLSAGLTFSKVDRETNILRIGWVAAEISRHGGVAVCSPIAPFDATRKQVRELVDQAGGEFVLVHIATPLEECERRDRKGLYAKARRGEIPEFTGISSPYEEPQDALLTIDTTGRTIDSCRDEVLAFLRQTHSIQ
jgi:sulfate adenylyltransferase